MYIYTNTNEIMLKTFGFILRIELIGQSYVIDISHHA